MATTPVNANSSTISSVNSSSQNTQRTPKKVLQKDDFMKLFVTQLKYQDPMKPLENNDMAIQLALFNQVDQLFNINDTLKSLVDLGKNLNLTYVSSLVDKKVKVDSNIGRVEQGQFLGGEFKVEGFVTGGEIVIRDSKGNLVKKIPLTDLKEGIHKIEWDGKDQAGNPVHEGNYTFSVLLFDGKTINSVKPTMVAKVTGSKLGEENRLVINGVQEIKLSDIKELIGG
ncbi:flagellar hook assembly protein FlgD [Thermodesulfobacterium hveragerdense]|uniref:flagellar hook assembly protein FlgD n=1 Tax=Thermodesulfobacterium hveragerdense TaxID=53424 RepID=UPI0004114B5D|nr:flagellar hook capping FlgD N-terminal domain-containing protein [Thermodesulfobacterium hveragerdense]